MPIVKQGFQAYDGLSAAADFLGNGAIEVNKYESEIVDMVRRDSLFLNRVDRKPATGHPHRYFEQLAIATAAFTDPRNIVPPRPDRTAWNAPPLLRPSQRRPTCPCSTST